jgi:hypothetical protein
VAGPFRVGGYPSPRVKPLEADYPAAVPEIAATMTWPGFRDVAVKLGLPASLSVPLFAGSGRTVAALNLSSRHPGAMATTSSSNSSPDG